MKYQRKDNIQIFLSGAHFFNLHYYIRSEVRKISKITMKLCHGWGYNDLLKKVDSTDHPSKCSSLSWVIKQLSWEMLTHPRSEFCSSLSVWCKRIGSRLWRFSWPPCGRAFPWWVWCRSCARSWGWTTHCLLRWNRHPLTTTPLFP